MLTRLTGLLTLAILIISVPPVFADSPGDTLGTTWDEWQSPACAVRMIALDEPGGVHFTWMNRVNGPSDDRHIYYNFINEQGYMLQPGGLQINASAESKYSCLDLTLENAAVVSYYNSSTGENCLLAVDALRGFGYFTEYDPPNQLFGDDWYFWPRITVDRQGYFHLGAIQHAMGGNEAIILYTRTDDGGFNWTTPVAVDTAYLSQSFVLASSPSNDRVAIAFMRPRNLSAPDIFDVMYVESDNGTTWDFANGDVNVTNYQQSDSIYLGIDLDAVYDNQGQLHLIWNAGRELVGQDDETRLYHWSETSGINMVASEPEWIDPEASDLPLSKPSLGVDSNDNLFAVWTRFSSDDLAVNGLPNGELFFSHSIDGGFSWSVPENVTNSPTPGCYQGECDSDHWASIAERVDDFVHVIYINDKYAGATAPAQPEDKTENPVLYLKLSNPTRASVENPEQGSLPGTFRLAQNHPNPFNASTVIRIEQGSLNPQQPATLRIVNLAGQEIKSFALDFSVPVQEVIWDGCDDRGEEVSSGVYFYELKSGDCTETKRMTLLR